LNILRSDCAKKLAGALFLVGEIGGNDYNYAFFQGIRSIEATKAYVPQVIKTIMSVAKASALKLFFAWNTSVYLVLCRTILVSQTDPWMNFAKE
jgi:hypothetical protein